MTALRQREPRKHDNAHLQDIRSLSCVVCLSNVCVDAAHIRFTAGPGKQNPGVGAKPDDCYVLPLCREHHAQQHSMGERNFWREMGLDPLRIAAQLYERRGCPEAMLGLIHELHRTYPDTSEIPF
jgi:hypothetical protein